MYKLNFRKRVWIVKHKLSGASTEKICLSQKISRMTLSKLMIIYQQFGWDGLKDHKTGRSDTILNQSAVILILDLRKRFGYGAVHIEHILKQKGFAISHRQIEKVLVRNGMVKPNPKKQKPRKWVRYELPNPNDMWHTDWSFDPFTNGNVTVYIDDRTRLITGFGQFKHQTTENTLAVLYSAVAEYGKPKSIMTDHGSQYYANHPNAEQEKTLFRSTLDVLGIRHCLARVNRPQTNGKVERFFRTYKEEYAVGTFSSLGEYIKHYNDVRLHMSLHYKTPKQVWEECKPLS
ncbi:TPA: transposase [Candidatus Woesearchaeota archaeon]|nr:transposase [Candidatus Woesearchaeota archaeon]